MVDFLGDAASAVVGPLRDETHAEQVVARAIEIHWERIDALAECAPGASAPATGS